MNLALKTSQRGSDTSAGGGLNAASLLAAIPHHGEVPHTYVGRPAVPGAQNPLGLTYVYSLQIPRLVIEDLVAAAMNVALGKGR